jgi:hypothetical protein
VGVLSLETGAYHDLLECGFDGRHVSSGHIVFACGFAAGGAVRSGAAHREWPAMFTVDQLGTVASFSPKGDSAGLDAWRRRGCLVAVTQLNVVLNWFRDVKRKAGPRTQAPTPD